MKAMPLNTLTDFGNLINTNTTDNANATQLINKTNKPVQIQHCIIYNDLLNKTGVFKYSIYSPAMLR